MHDITHPTSQTIVLVEDSVGYQDLIVEAFDYLKFSQKLEVFSTGEELLEFLTLKQQENINWCPDLILIDLHLPKMDGYELLKILKSDSRIQLVPVIVFSNSSNPDDIKKSYQLNANCYICKPTELKELLLILQSLVNFWFSIATLPDSFSVGHPHSSLFSDSSRFFMRNQGRIQ